MMLEETLTKEFHTKYKLDSHIFLPRFSTMKNATMSPQMNCPFMDSKTLLILWQNPNSSGLNKTNYSSKFGLHWAPNTLKYLLSRSSGNYINLPNQAS